MVFEAHDVDIMKREIAGERKYFDRIKSRLEDSLQSNVFGNN